MDRADFIEGLGLRARNLKPRGEQSPSAASCRKLILPCQRARCNQPNRERYCDPVAFEIEHMNLWVAAAINEIVCRPRPAWPALLTSPKLGIPEGNISLCSKLVDAMLRHPGHAESPSCYPAVPEGRVLFSPAGRCSPAGLGLRAALLILAFACATAAQAPNPQKLFQQADEAQQRGDNELAVRKYQELIRLHPEMVAARANLGIALVALGRFDEAIAQYHAALAQAPGDPVLQLDLALAWYKQGEFGKAASELEMLPRRQPDNRQALYLLADCYLRLGRNGDAVKLLEPAYQAHPGDHAVDYALGTALIRDGQAQKGEQVIDRILKDGNTAEANLLMGAVQLAAGDGKSAATTIHQALDRDPKLPGGWSLYGRALMKGGDNEGAKAAFERAIQADPSDFEANFHFGRLLRLSGNNAEAAPYLERALRLRPDSLSARFQVGALDLALGHLDEAQKDLERVARESPDYQAVHVQLAALYYRLNRPQDGERERQIVLRLNQKARQQGPQPEP